MLTTDASHVAAVPDNITRIAKDVAVAAFEREVHLEIGEQVVAGHEVVGVRQAVRFGLAAAQMALAADGNNLFGIPGMLFGEPDERRIVGVILGRYAVARIAIERGRRESVGLRVNRRSVTARAAQCERLLIPRLAVAR